MQIALLLLSQITGLIPFNVMNRRASVFDFLVMIVVPGFYFASFSMAHLGGYSPRGLPACGKVCSLASTLIINLGAAVYITDCIFALYRGKYFFPEFYNQLNRIDDILQKCEISTQSKKKGTHSFRFFLLIALIAAFLYGVIYDIYLLSSYFGTLAIMGMMTISFPFVASSIVQVQFIYLVHLISQRFEKLVSLLESISTTSLKNNGHIKIFDLENESLKKKKPKRIASMQLDDSVNGERENDKNPDEDLDSLQIYSNTECNTSSENLVDLFLTHEKILVLSNLTNGEYGPQTVVYAAVCFVIMIFGIFLETKVIFVAKGQNNLVDYMAQVYQVWGVNTTTVGYILLRLCCNANRNSKQSAMVVHEVMQKKPPFMLGGDTYYNKMKSFTLQYLHWDEYFQFNAIGMFILDYTFIFSTLSTATSYLIVLLQFDMTNILRQDGLIK